MLTIINDIRKGAKALAALGGAALLLTAGGCAEDPELPAPNPGMTGVVLNIPSTESLGASSFTRAVEEAIDAQEGKISSLQFFAFPKGEGERVYTTFDTSNPLKSDIYNQYPVKMKPGSYNIYLVANYADVPNPSTISEAELLAHYIQYDSNYSPTLNPETGLPMSCRPTDIKESADGAYLTGAVTVEGGEAKSLWCDMSFTMAKVRLNIIYEKGTDATVSALNVTGISSRSKLIQPTANGTEKDMPVLDGYVSLLDCGGYYNINDYKETLAERPVLPTLAGGKSEPSGRGAWLYQAVAYVPERILEAGAADQTAVSLTIGDEEKSFRLGGEPGTNGAIPATPTELRRSRLYDYTLRANGLLTLAVEGWTPHTIMTSLSGPIELIVEHTVLGSDTEPLKGGDALTDYYYSNVNVDFESPKWKLADGTEIPIYIIEKMEEGMKKYIRVSVNPLMPVMVKGSNDANSRDFYNNPGKYHYIYAKAGTLWKKIDIVPDLSAYLTVTPPVVDIRVKNMREGADNDWLIPYHYATNLPKLTCEVSYTYQTTDYQAAGYTNGFPPESEMKCASNYSLGNAGGTQEFDRSQSLHEISLKEALNTSLYNRETVIRFRYTATDGSTTLTAATYLHIYPYNRSYTLHFRTVDDSWDNVHVYVYEPLSYYCYDNSHGGREEWVMCHDENGMYENAVRHSYTGKVTFNGYDYLRENNNMSLLPAHMGTTLYRYVSKNDFYFTNENLNTNIYNEAVDYIAKHREQIRGVADVCDGCKNKIERKWPGVQMIRESGENEGWWKITLPDMCVPGKTLIMFVKQHGNVEQEAYQDRYPLHLRPGVPLYDYEDREGWFLYDKKQNTESEFVDDKPAYFILNEKVRFIWDKTTYDKKGYSKIHVWNPGDSNGYDNWGTVTGKVMTYNGKEVYYYEINVSRANLIGINYLLYEHDNHKSADMTFLHSNAVREGDCLYLVIPDNIQ